MKQIKPVFLVALVIVVAALLAACGAQSQPTATPLPTAAPATPTPIPDYWQRIQQEGKMLVGTSADYPPFQFYDANFQLDGFDIALMREVGKKLGIEIEFNDFAFDGLGGALFLGQIETAIAAISVTPERQALADFSNVYYVGEDAVLADEDSDLQIATKEETSSLRIGVQRGSVYESFITQELVEPGILPEQNLLLYTDVGQGVKDLEKGLIDVVMLDLAPAQEFVAQGGVKIVAQGLNKQRFAIAMPKGQAALRRVINQALTDLQNEGVVADLAEQYLGVDEEDLQPIPVPTPEPPTPTPAPEQPTATPAPPPVGCIDGMAWVADLSYDDHNMTAPPVLQPGQTFVKGWRVRNTGTCTWNSSYFLGFVQGDAMGGQPAFVRGQVAPGATFDFQVNLVAPTAPGTYQGFWQMTGSNGRRFGETIWVGIQVAAAPTPTPAPTQTPVAGISFTVNTTNIQAGQCVVFQWNVTNAQAVYFYAEGQNWQDHGVAGQGSQTECPPTTTTYYLRVVGRDGSVQTREITIYVTPAAGAPTITRFSANPPGPINLGQCTNLDWVVQGTVSNVQLSRNGVILWNNAPVSGNLQDCPTNAGTMAYQLQATGPGGTSQAMAYVTVNQATPPTATPVPPTPTPIPPTPTPVPPTPPPQPQISSFTANPLQIQAGQCTNLSWSTGGGTAFTRITRNGAMILDNGPISGNQQDCPDQTGTVVYQLEANGGGTSVFQEISINVEQAAPPLVGAWSLTQMNGQGLVSGTSITVNFSNGQVSGNGGCNSYNGTYSTTSDGGLSIGGITTTNMMCPEEVMRQEQTYLGLLSGAARYQMSGPNLTIFDGGGAATLVYSGAR
jgi:polar amino acid transport system substrate-binding protein